MPDLERTYREIETAHALRRIEPADRQRAQAARRRRTRTFARTVLRIVAAIAAIWIAAGVIGMIAPIGQMGFLAALLLSAAALVVILLTAGERPETRQTLAATGDLALLPRKTESWLHRQRPALPAPAIRIVDGIGLKLETLAPQLAGLNPAEPIAADVRKLLSEELPELIEGYARVPQGLRKQERDGPSPDRQLVEGLSVVDRQLAEMSENLAAGDLRALATQQRYLELKYKDDGEG